MSRSTGKRPLKEKVIPKRIMKQRPLVEIRVYIRYHLLLVTGFTGLRLMDARREWVRRKQRTGGDESQDYLASC